MSPSFSRSILIGSMILTWHLNCKHNIVICGVVCNEKNEVTKVQADKLIEYDKKKANKKKSQEDEYDENLFHHT